jgi:hypothetical protein
MIVIYKLVKKIKISKLLYMTDVLDNENIDNLPLIKEKKNKIKQEEIRQEEEVKTPPIKEKRPRSAKQLQQFEILKQKRKENIEKAKELKKIEAAKLLLEVENKTTKPVKKQPIKEESSSEEEQIIIKKDKKKKKKTKVIIMASSESETESTKSDHMPVRKFTHQQNKKSIIKVDSKPLDNKNSIFIKKDTKNYFLD